MILGSKANASQAIPELIQIATNRRFEENKKDKHAKDAKNKRKYLYDILEIKKETGGPLVSEDSTVKTHFPRQ